MKSLILFRFVIAAMVFLLEVGGVYGQKPMIDSLEEELRRVGNSDSQKLQILLNLSYRISNNSPIRAEEYARSAIDLSRKLQTQKELARAYRYLGTSFLDRSLYIQALTYYDSSESIAKAIGDNRALSAVWSNIGLVYEESQADYTRALGYAFRALRMNEELGNNDAIVNSLFHIGTLYYRQKDYTTALQYYKRAKELLGAVNNPESISEVYYGIGLVHKDRNNFDQALKYFDTALATARQYNHDRLRGDITHDIGSTYLFQKNAASAHEYLQEALNVRQMRGDKTGVANTLAAFGDFSVLRNDPFKAKEYFSASLRLADELGLKETQMNVLSHLGELYKRQRKFEEALEYKERSLVFRDSLFNAERSREIGRLEMRHQVEQKEAENQLLIRDRALRDANESRSQLLVIALIVVLIFSVGIALMLWRFGNNQRLINTELQRHQELVEEQAKEIEFINTELQERNILLTDANHELQSAYTQIHRQTESLQEKNLALERLNTEKNEFLGIVAHDLKNPLSSILLSANMAVKYRSKMSEAEHIDMIQKVILSAERMFSIVTNLLDVNAIETGSLPISYSHVALVPLVQGVVAEYQERAKSKGISILYSREYLGSVDVNAMSALDTDTAVVYADRTIVTNIVDNLLSNALKYSPHGKNVFVRLKPGGGNVKQEEPTNSVFSPPTSSFLRLEVQDEGPGLSEEDKTKLFGKFARLSAQPTGGEHSTGLGLSIVKKMVEAMNGRVWCESEFGKGATFIVELPQGNPSVSA